MRATIGGSLMVCLIVVGGCTYGQLASLDPRIGEIEDRVRGRENEPAEKVFENIQIFKGMPAGRVLELMTDSFSPALGVSCSHCHVSGEWHLDDKEPKRIAREMWGMTGEINKKVRSIADPNAQVRCATCHQGHTKPPLNP
ncbi:MAG TPA: photosynthetic reaction center cytochrome c subunit family protein [Thermoanaerobaculia bacterium]|nr:photosynthetic reaction center cytochrome c subunit family protein [Thermoanaerobaculia bacterium]